MLLYNLPSEISIAERETRNLQRCFGAGYIDIGFTSYITEGLAGYMAKYMAKNIGNGNNERTRNYCCSRNIEKVYHAGSNTLAEYVDMIVDEQGVQKLIQYDTLWLGRCDLTVYKNQKLNDYYRTGHITVSGIETI